MNNMTKYAAIAIAAMTLPACVSTAKPVAMKTPAASLKGGIITVTEKEPTFGLTRPTTAGLGLVGAAIAIENGKTFPGERGIIDPALQMEKEISDYLQSNTELSATAKTLAKTGEKDLATLPVESDMYYLDAETNVWGITYYPFNWAKYRVLYNADIRLIDGKDKSVIAAHNCKYDDPKKPANALTYDELNDNNAKHLKDAFQSYASRCVDEFKSKSLMIP